MTSQRLKPIAILGAGSWGTALALYLARRGQMVNIWSIMPDEIQAMLKDKTNNRYLPGFPLPDTLKPIADLSQSLTDVEDILIVVPSIGYRKTLELLKPLIKPNMRIISASKGLDETTGKLPNEMVVEVLGNNYPFAVLSGPSFAREVAASLPCAVVIASENKNFRSDLVTRFDSNIFRIECSDDVVGAEIGGVVKNVIAIATGISDGLGYGTNARSAIITFGLAEISRLNKKMGGKLETMLGLAGMGDLILTCSDNQSRNKRLGLALGQGKNIAEAEREIGQVVEGKRNAEIVVKLARKSQITMPICENIWLTLQDKITAKNAIERIFADSI